MFSQQLYEQWAPPGGLWSPWAKPVLFLNLDAVMLTPQPPVDFSAVEAGWAPPAGEAAIVLDLPGDAGVVQGIALARKGYRPVPLYNCCAGPSAVLDVAPIVRALVAGAEVLDKLNLPWIAPPVFLLDSRRTDVGKGSLTPGKFDNRWITLPQDFPSANLLRSRGINRAIIVQDQPRPPRDDLAHVLLRWQEAGMTIEGAEVGARPAPMRVNKPSWFRAMFYTFIATAGLRRSSAGGFGSVIPQPSSGHG